MTPSRSPTTSRQPRARGTAATGRRATIQVIDGVRRLERGLRLAARRVESQTGLSAAQLFVLEHLTHAPAASLLDLARRTLTDRTSVAAVVERLADAGLVTRTTASEDRRRAEVRITRAGRAVLARAPRPPTDLLLTAVRRMAPADIRRLAALLSELNDRLGFEEAPLLFANGA